MDNTGRSSSRHWRRLFILNPERRDFLEDLRTFGRLWAYGETDNPDRVLFFARYIGHSDHVLHNMALVEIGRAPYALVRPLSDRVPASLILQEFSNINRFAYRSAAIRLLGLQSDPQARSFVRARYVRSLESGGLNSFEWALAGIEADQSTAISAIGAALQDPGKTKEHKKALIRALAEAGTLQSEFKPKIVQFFSAALENDPEFLVQIAVATRNWGETALHQQFEALAALEETDLATQFVLNMVWKLIYRQIDLGLFMPRRCCTSTLGPWRLSRPSSQHLAREGTRLHSSGQYSGQLQVRRKEKPHRNQNSMI